MGVKSTRTLTRAQAEEMYVDLKIRIRKYSFELSDVELEDELERMNDAVNGGEGFENYIIE